MERTGEILAAEIPYVVNTGEKLINETFGPNNIRRRRTGIQEMKRVNIHNGRVHLDQLSLDGTGFILVQHSTKVTDFFDRDQIQSIYFAEVERLIQETSGARRVVVFDHTLRSGDEGEREARLIREPVLSAHNDYTEASGPQRVREVLPGEAEDLLKRRFAIIQVWRAINLPIESNPLAVADAKSVDMDDFLVAERRYPHRVGQTYRLIFNPRHRWYYFPRMQRDEALVFKVYDSETDGRARFTPHSSFDDPTTPAGAQARQSIEARALAFLPSGHNL